MHPVIRGPARQYLHSQTVTTDLRRGCNVLHDTPRALSAHRGVGITSESTTTQSVQGSEMVAGEDGGGRGRRGGKVGSEIIWA